MNVLPERRESGWVASLKALCFGYDFFISYSQEAATRAYGQKLQAMLTDRDYAVFRDTTNLEAGDPLTLRIRWSLWRTRCLIVLGTRQALASEWVMKEIGIFARRKRRIVPLDLEQIRSRHSWIDLKDSLFENDTLPDPSPYIVERIIGSFRGWKANKLARLVLGTVALVAIAGAGILTWQALSLRERALRMRTQSIVAIAQSLADPVTRGLVLAEADRDRLPANAVRTAREIARSRVPETILRVSSKSFAAAAVSVDDRWVFTVDDANVLRRWPMDGASDPTTLCTLPWRVARIDALESAVLCSNDSHAALVATSNPGPAQYFEKPSDDAIDALKPGASKPGTERWVVADRSPAWRAAMDGKTAAFALDAQGALILVHASDGEWLKVALATPGRAILDIHLGEQAADGSFAGLVLCTDGSFARFTCDAKHASAVEWLPGSFVTTNEHLCLPDRVSDGRAYYAHGSIIVAGLGSGGIVTANQGEKWAPRIFRTTGARKLRSWTVSDNGTSALLQWEQADASQLQLSDFSESPQPISTRVRILTQSDYVMGLEAQPAESGTPEAPEMKHPGISGDGDLVVLPTLRNAWLWSVKAGHPIGVIRAGLFFDEQIRPTFTHDGTRFVTADSSGELRVWRSDGGDLDPRVAGLGSQTVKLATGTNAVVLAGTSKGQVFLVDAGNGKAPRLLSFRPGQFARCAVSPTGLRGAAIFKDGLVTLFALPTGSILGTVQCEKTASKSVSYEDVEFVGEDYVVAFNGVTPSLIDFQAGQIVARDTNGWNSVGASEGPGARNLLATTESGALKVMEVPTLRVVRTLSVNTKATVWSSALSPSGLLAAAGLGDGHVLVFDLSSQAQPVSIAVAGGEISVDCVAIDSAGKRLAFGAYDGRAGVVDLRKPLQPRWFQAPDLEQATGAARNNYAHLGVVEDVRFSPDGGFLVTCSGLDGFTRVWQTDGRCIEALNTSGAATFARLLDDGRLVTMTEQGEVSLWRVGVRALLDHFRARSNATLLPPERIRYLNEEPGEANKRYREQERLRGRTPLPPEFTKIDYR